MTYPINEQDFVEIWINLHSKPCDERNKEFARIMAGMLNDAYDAGVDDGKKIN